MGFGSDEQPPAWQELLAVGLVVGELTAAAISRFGGCDIAIAEDALARAREEGLVDDDGMVDAATCARLVRVLHARRIAEAHAAAARRALGGPPDDLRTGLRHLRDGVSALSNAELLELADRAGRFALDVADGEAARDLLRLARLAVWAAELLALPADWQAGDPRVMGVLERIQRMPKLDEDDRVRLLAVRAWVEARLPVAVIDRQQVSWIGRPSIARPLADEALAASHGSASGVRLLALIAWRHTHRAPQFLAERRAASEEALRIAEQIGADAEQVEAAVLLAVDELESGDRAAHRVALTTAAAVANRSAQPRLRWRALVPAAGAAFMDDDVDAARAIAEDAFDAGAMSRAPGFLASRMTFTGQLASRHDDGPSTDESLAADARILATSSLGRAGLSHLLARRTVRGSTRPRARDAAPAR